MKILKHCYKKIEQDSRRWKDLPFSWINGINIVKMSVLSKIKLQNNLIKTPVAFRELESNPKFHMEAQKTSNNQRNL